MTTEKSYTVFRRYNFKMLIRYSVCLVGLDCSRELKISSCCKERRMKMENVGINRASDYYSRLFSTGYR